MKSAENLEQSFDYCYILNSLTMDLLPDILFSSLDRLIIW